MRALSRRLVLLSPLLAAACHAAPPPARTHFESLAYGYLKKLPLNVASIQVDNQAGATANDVAADSPVTPVQALTQMAHDRLEAAGSAGSAVMVIRDASILRRPDGLSGRLNVRLDILTGSGNPVAFAEARVARVMTGGTADLRAAAYDLTRQMMDDMNVEFEYQVRRSLRDYLLPDSTAPVQAQPLPAP